MRTVRRLVDCRHEEQPIDWERRFGNGRALEVEIGCGDGTALAARAVLRPERNFVGIDRAGGYARKTLARLEDIGTENALVLRADARVALRCLFEAGSISRVWALFPEPGSGKRATRGRLFSTPFFRLLNTRMVMDGEVLLVTDHGGYALWMHGQARGTGFQVDCVLQPPRFGTPFERKALNAGQRLFYHITLRKMRKQEADTPAWDQDLAAGTQTPADRRSAA